MRVPVLLVLAFAAGCATGGRTGARADEVRFPGAGLQLAGTLHVPSPEGRHPAVVLVHGSGPQSRDEPVPGQLDMGFGFSFEVFAELAEELGDAGIVVLRYDKRTCGPFNGCADNGYPKPENVLVDDFVADAVAAADWLRAQPSVDPERVFVVGHSQGATLVPAILAERPWLRGGAMLAANHRPIDAIVAYQADFTRKLLRELGWSEERIAGAVEKLDGIARDLAALRAGTFEGEATGGASAAFWASAFRSGERAVALAPTLDRPLLVVGGGYDWNVPPAEAEAWRAGFEAAGATRHRVVVVPCVTHALNCVREPDWKRIHPTDIGREIAPAVVEELVRFLSREDRAAGR